MYSFSTLLARSLERYYRVAKAIEIIQSKELGCWSLKDVRQVFVILPQMRTPIKFVA